MRVPAIISYLKDPLDVAPTDPIIHTDHSAPDTPLKYVRQDEEVMRSKQLQTDKLRVAMTVLRD